MHGVCYPQVTRDIFLIKQDRQLSDAEQKEEKINKINKIEEEEKIHK